MSLEFAPPVAPAEAEALRVALARAEIPVDSRALVSGSAWQRAGICEAVGCDAVERLVDVGSPSELGPAVTRARP